jgi:hypothetical protein
MTKQHERSMDRETPLPSIDRGELRGNVVGRWEITRNNPHEQPFAELTSGDMVFLDVDGEWRLTRIEYDHAAKSYVSVDGYRLADGIMAALPTA